MQEQKGLVWQKELPNGRYKPFIILIKSQVSVINNDQEASYPWLYCGITDAIKAPLTN